MIDVDTVRKLALALPEAQEHDHWGRPSFRVRNKIFATLWPAEQRAVLKLAPGDQTALATLDPHTYTLVSGAPGNQGWTNVQLAQVDPADFAHALEAAWCQVAPKRLIAAFHDATRR